MALIGWQSLEQGLNGIAHIKAEVLVPFFGPGIAAPGGHWD